MSRAQKKKGMTVAKILLIEKPLAELGEVGIKIHPEVVAKIKVWVTKK